MACCLVAVGAAGCAAGTGHPAPGDAVPVARTAPQPVAALPSPPAATPATPPTPGTTPTTATTAAPASAGAAGVPIRVRIGVPSSHHPQGVRASVVQHGLSSAGWIYIPPDPAVLAWDSDDAAVTADHGTAIIAGHINYVINGRTVVGALVDLAEYARTGIGKVVTVTLSSGDRVRFRIAEVRVYTKDDLAADAGLRERLYDQKGRYGPQHAARLLLVSCGGPFDPDTGEYLENVFVYAYRIGKVITAKAAATRPHAGAATTTPTPSRTRLGRYPA
jgi:hypothetical protein